MMARARFLSFFLACSLCVPVTARGQEQARPDPDSPAGVEYQLPLDQAREDAAGEGTSGPGRRGPPPSFGSGISEGGHSSPTADTSSEGGSATRERKPEATLAGRTGQPAAPVASQGGSGGAIVALIVAAVMIAGGGLGLGLRRGMGGTGTGP